MTRYAANAPDFFPEPYEEALTARRDERAHGRPGGFVSYADNGGHPVGYQPPASRHPAWPGYNPGKSGTLDPASGPITSRLQAQGMGAVPQSPVPMGHIRDRDRGLYLQAVHPAGAGPDRLAFGDATMSWPPWFRRNHKSIQWIGWALVLFSAVVLVVIGTLASH